MSKVNIEKPKGKSPRKVLEHADQVSKQIAIDIELAKAQDGNAVAIFEMTDNEYQAFWNMLTK